MLQQPLQCPRRQGLARRAEDWIDAVPEGINVRAVGHQQLHHGDTAVVKGSTHQGTVAACMDIGAGFDEKQRDGQALGHGRGRAPALGGPGERTISPVANRSLQQGRIGRDHLLHAGQFAARDRLLQRLGLREQLDLLSQADPAREAVLAGERELGVGQSQGSGEDRFVRSAGEPGKVLAEAASGLGVTGLVCFAQLLRLMAKLLEVGPRGKRARHAESPFISAWCPRCRQKEDRSKAR